MSTLSIFLIFMVSLTALVLAYLTKQFQEENLIYLNNNQMKNSKTKTQTIEKEKVVAETINGRFAMLGLMAAIGAYLTTGQIIPGFV
ncbi:high light inducible protein [Prochlorococcus marinus]|uniref:high light inducible protein n=1 Tax=Prochlorococcus marinus TaxID=1219 RepID=UPI001AD9FB7B|nr:high light inducible protein [Prochlorococcus marinus]MBO8205125.1 high light inducible protein [Prochlorococcus marinus CUG1415]